MKNHITTKIKVLHTLSSASLAGTERALLMLLDGGDRNRFEHYVALPETGPIEKHLADRGVHSIIIKRGRFSPAYHFKLAALMARLRPHILHIHYSRLDAISARVLGIKTVERKNLTRENWHPTVSRNSLLDKIANSFIQFVITPSKYTRDYYIERKLTAAGKIVVIYNGLDLPLYEEEFDPAALRQSLGIEETDTVVTTVGRLVPLKGQRDAISATAILAPRFPELKLLIIGDGPKKEPLIELACKAGIADKVIFTGERHDVHNLLRISTLFIHPSYTEALSNSILEAFASRCPVVATDIPGNSEIVENETNGLLVPVENPQALATAISKILEDKPLAAKFTQNGRALIERYFLREHMAAETENIYMKLIETL